MAGRGRPRGTGGGIYVPGLKTTGRQLYCDRCNHVIALQCGEDPVAWPQHRCRATHRAEPFSGWREIPPIPQRVWIDL